MKKQILVVFASALLLAGCAAFNVAQGVRRRAAFDLKCPQSALTVVRLGSRSYGVRGCGKRASYVTLTGCYTEQGCRIAMNSRSGK